MIRTNLAPSVLPRSSLECGKAVLTSREVSDEEYWRNCFFCHLALANNNVRYTTLTHQQVLMETAFQSLELAE